MIFTIHCTCGKPILLDKEVYNKVFPLTFSCADGTVVTIDNSKGRPKRVALARLVIKVPDGFEPDHKNRNSHDNRAENLRVAKHHLNVANQGLAKHNTTGFKGVHATYRPSPWAAHIQYKGRKINLGSFMAKEEAARAYDKAAMYYFGEFAVTNYSLGLLQDKPEICAPYQERDVLEELMTEL